MKKILAMALVLCMSLTILAGCGGSSAPAETTAAPAQTDSGAVSTDAPETAADLGDTLVIYSACNEDILSTVIPMFEEKYGIKVELLTDGIGSLLKRVQSESANPYCDVVFGGTESVYYAYMDQFQEYVSPNDQYMLDGHHVYQNKLTPINTDSNLIMWNNDLIGDIKVASYKDLLQPELKGTIALPDPASSGTGSGTICDFVWLYGNGDWDSQEGWDFVKQFVDQLDGKVSPSSGNAHKSVADGENTITVTYEGAAFAYLKNGANVSIAYPTEGVVASNAMTAIVKDCQHLEAAKAFVDFVTSKEVQDLFGTVLLSRPVRADAELADFIPSADTITYFERSQEDVAAHKDAVIEKFNEIFADAQG